MKDMQFLPFFWASKNRFGTAVSSGFDLDLPFSQKTQRCTTCRFPLFTPPLSPKAFAATHPDPSGEGKHKERRPGLPPLLFLAKTPAGGFLLVLLDAFGDVDDCGLCPDVDRGSHHVLCHAIQAAGLDAERLGLLSCVREVAMDQARAAPRAKGPLCSPVRVRPAVHCDRARMGLRDLEGWEGRRHAVRRRRLVSTFCAVADVDRHGFGQRRRETDLAALAAAFHLG